MSTYRRLTDGSPLGVGLTDMSRGVFHHRSNDIELTPRHVIALFLFYYFLCFWLFTLVFVFFFNVQQFLSLSFFTLAIASIATLIHVRLGRSNRTDRKSEAGKYR